MGNDPVNGIDPNGEFTNLLDPLKKVKEAVRQIQEAADRVAAVLLAAKNIAEKTTEAVESGREAVETTERVVTEGTAYVAAEGTAVAGNMGADGTVGVAYDGKTGDVVTFKNGTVSSGGPLDSEVEGAHGGAGLKVGFVKDRSALTSTTVAKKFDVGVLGGALLFDTDGNLVGGEINIPGLSLGFGGSETEVSGSEGGCITTSKETSTC